MLSRLFYVLNMYYENQGMVAVNNHFVKYWYLKLKMQTYNSFVENENIIYLSLALSTYLSEEGVEFLLVIL
jgi:hypothetical protein